jgi:hypothetical protein
MNERPVIMLSFANQQDAYLEQLKAESNIINDILSMHHDRGNIEVYREESASIDNMAKAITRFKDRIIAFHYAGHADGQNLYFEEGKGDADGIAELLGQLPELKFVFLNGCSTKDQVDKLLNAGVKAVIATAVDINDEKAVVFAEHFYRAFANKNDIEKSFRFAVSIMRTKYGGTFQAEVMLKGQEPNVTDPNRMPWGLYLNENPKEVLEWSIPTHFTTKVTRPDEVDYQVNSFMVDIFNAILDYNPTLEDLAYNSFDDSLDERKALSLVIEQFPWPIGVQIRLLVTKDTAVDEPTRERVQQLVSTYIVSAQFLYYIAISQLWDEKRKRNIELKSYLMDLMYSDSDSFNYFDFLRYFVDIIHLLEEHNCELFVPEFSDFVKEFDERGELYNAYLYMESLRNAINVGDPATLEANMHQSCADGEYFLSSILIKAAFLIQYDLITIRDIHVINPRYLGTSFEHYIGRLNAKITDVAVSRALRPRAFEIFANNASVILTKDAQKLEHFLNLSPFIIDKNAFGHNMAERATEQQLFMYAFREAEEFKYFATIHNIYRVQERLADQFITSEGRGDEEDSRYRKRRTRRTRRGQSEQQEAESPFEVLKKQFDVFQKDMMQ